MFLVLFILHDVELIDDILNAWEEVGVGGATVLRSYGLGRIRKIGLREDIPLFPSLEQLLENEEEFSRTLLTIVDNREVVDKVVEATQSITGNLDKPDTGLLAVLPVEQVYGLQKRNYNK